MSKTPEQERALVVRGEVRVSLHGYEELAADRVHVRDIIDGLEHKGSGDGPPNNARLAKRR